MNAQRALAPILLVAAASAAGGCNESGDDAGGVDDPVAMQRAERIVKVNDFRIAEGKRQFSQCAPCHGERGEGRVGMAPSLASKSFLEAASDQMLIDTIKNGREGTTMVPFGDKLEQHQVEGLVAYIRSLQPTKPALLDESPLDGNVERGSAVFSSICATCHGRKGAGYQESGSGTGIGRKVFLSTVSNGYLRYIIKNGKSGTPMKAFAGESRTAVANLSQQQIEDVIAYMRESAW